jgi:hypothetical protein
MNFHPDAALDNPGLALAASDGVEPAQTCWNAMISEAQKAIQVTLEELALLAGVATVAAETAWAPHADAAPRSPYSLLLEPALFRFPS